MKNDETDTDKQSRRKTLVTTKVVKNIGHEKKKISSEETNLQEDWSYKPPQKPINY